MKREQQVRTRIALFENLTQPPASLDACGGGGRKTTLVVIRRDERQPGGADVVSHSMDCADSVESRTKVEVLKLDGGGVDARAEQQAPAGSVEANLYASVRKVDKQQQRRPGDARETQTSSQAGQHDDDDDSQDDDVRIVEIARL